mmetsp:Transcript_123887/g.214775  ORF Transcript_123887/g.214775 Transcript_123887/m.214775 type:complete len:210 (+) Transcript_123887:89-718(+)
MRSSVPSSTRPVSMPAAWSWFAMGTPSRGQGPRPPSTARALWMRTAPPGTASTLTACGNGAWLSGKRTSQSLPCPRGTGSGTRSGGVWSSWGRLSCALCSMTGASCGRAPWPKWCGPCRRIRGASMWACPHGRRWTTSSTFCPSTASASRSSPWGTRGWQCCRCCSGTTPPTSWRRSTTGTSSLRTSPTGRTCAGGWPREASSRTKWPN